MKRLLVFVCISNRNRSPFAEFFFSKLISERDKELVSKIRATSCGFIPQKMKEKLAELQIAFPDPHFGRPLPLSTRTVLLQEDIAVPDGWKSKPLSPKVVKEADMIITVLPEQKKDLVHLYPEAAARICTIREISRWNGFLSWEEHAAYKRLPSDINFWDYAEEDMDHVSIALSEMKKMLIMAYSGILEKLGINHDESGRG